MTVLTDVSVDWNATPRVVEFGLTVDAVTVQDIMDTLRVIEMAPLNMSYDILILPPLTGGKQPLDVAQTKKVGLTVTLYNAKLKFATRGAQTFIRVEEGNLVAIEEDGQTFYSEPFLPSTNVNILYAADQSPSLVESGTSGLTPSESAALLNIEADVAQIQTDVGQVQLDIASIDGNVVTINSNIAAIAGDISTLQGDVAQIDAALVNIESDVGILQTDVGFIQADMALVKKILRNKKITYKSGPNVGKMVIYDDDNVTPLLVAQIWEDDAGSIPYQGSGLERQDRLDDAP